MSYVFRLHTTGSIELKGWEKSKKIGQPEIQTIPDTVRRGASSKIGSSIPTPLARLYLFETAFQMVVNKPIGDSMYHHLVSDCLDLFQFIYLNAGGSDLVFRKWNVNRQIEGLRNSSFNEHRQLADSLDMAFKSKKLEGTREIYLIYYKKKLVGGTSPITGVFTSPNWKSIVQKQGWIFETPIGDILFDDVPYTIFQRDVDFQTYMFKFIYAYNGALAQKSSAFYNYFDNCRIHEPQVNKLCTDLNINPNYSPQQLLIDYDYIEIVLDDEGNKENLFSGQCAIVKQKAANIPVMIQESSDFLMMPNIDFYKDKTDDEGSSIPNYPPLVLVNGNHHLNYIDSEWDPDIRVIDLPTIPLHKRKLPKFNTYTYPFVTIGDFFQETLIELPFNLDRDRFFTGYGGNFKYLLPIKKEYFNFFTIDDLEDQLSVSKNADIYEINLKIPIKGGNHINLGRSYDLNDPSKVAKSKNTVGFNIGFFPFYKVVDKAELNRYSIMLVSNQDDVKLSFFNYDGVVNNQKVKPKEEISRTKQTRVDAGSVYYDISKESFDFIEVSRGQILKGLVIPKMKEVRVEENNKQFTFAIDFGTSNTHIAYDTNDQSQDVMGFDINENDRQMILLSETKKDGSDLDRKILDGLGGFAQTMGMMEREFVPNFISNKSSVQFPVRTATCENMNFRNDAKKLFGNINIGFSLERDVQKSDDEYQTNIKWMLNSSRNDHRPKARIEAFFEEMMWMIKNKILMNGGKIAPAPEIITMIPLSMRLKSRGTFKDLWQQAADRVFGDSVITIDDAKFESIMPYYSVIEDKGANVMNVDIGGGTTDVFIFDKESDRYYSTSFKFAGNDIWGEGINNTGKKDNGFFKFLDEKYQQQQIKLSDDKVETAYQYFKGRSSLGSADICSFLFKYDGQFKFSDYITNHPPLLTLLFIHFGAILYQLGQILNLKELDIPEEISFTGKGSEYLKLISKDQGIIAKVTKLLIETFTGKTASRFFKVSISKSPKELTAEGAIKEKSAAAGEKISEGQVDSFIFNGFGKIVTNQKVEPSTVVGAHSGNPVDEQDSVPATQNDPNAKEEIGPFDIIRVDKIGMVKPKVQVNFEDFLAKMQTDSVKSMLREFDVKFRYSGFDVIEYLKDYGIQKSYRSVTNSFKVKVDPDEELKENTFFWFFKDALYELSKELYKKG